MLINLHQNKQKDEILSIFWTFTFNRECSIIDERTILLPAMSIKQAEFQEIVWLCDSISSIITIQYAFDISPTEWIKDVSYRRELNPTATMPQQTVCIVDSGIQKNIRELDPLLQIDPNINYSFDSSSYFDDSCLLSGHWTGVASIVAYGEQFLNKELSISPYLKICSAKILDDNNETSATVPQIIEAIRQIHISSWGTIRIFNLFTF